MRSQWSRANVSPHDWVNVLKTHLRLGGHSDSSKGCCEWLAERGCPCSPVDLSKLKAIHDCWTTVNPRLDAILKKISAEVDARSAIIYFEGLTYRGLKFFFPQGNPQRIDPTSMPDGIYQATRYSFARPGSIVRSAFSFYRNSAEREVLHGYGDSLNVEWDERFSDVVRFKELRVIETRDAPSYQILVGGFVFYNRTSFYLVGAAFETALGVEEASLRMSDVRHVQAVWYILDDDNDPNLIRGVKVTSLRNEGDPAAAVVELKKVPELNYTDWSEITTSAAVEIGVFDESSIDFDLSRLNPDASDKFNMLVVNRIT